MARAGVVAAVLAVALLLSGCTQGSPLVRGSAVTVATAEPFTSYNPRSVTGATPANAAISDAANSRFFTPRADGSLEPDPSFGTAEVLDTDPLTVRYTLASTATWSDGVPVDAADLLLAWAATSGRFATSGVDFAAADHRALDRVTMLPQLGADDRSITLEFDEVVADWRYAFEVGLPAHVVAEAALGPFDGASENDSEEERAAKRAAGAKAAVVEAIQTADIPTLTSLAEAWNTAFDAEALAQHPERLVGSGAYRVTAVEPGVSVTLVANPRYEGDHRPTIETVVVRTIADPLEAVAEFADGTVDVVAPESTAEVEDALGDLEGVTLADGRSAAFEHLDLQFADSRSGHFDDGLVREAFLLVVPRERIAGDAVLRDSFVLAPGQAGYDDAVAGNGSAARAEVDVPEARRLLAEAGVGSPEVCILFDPTNESRRATFEHVRDSAADAGFVVTDCSRPDWTRVLGTSGAYDAALFGWTPSSTAISIIDDRLRSDSAVSNLNRYASETVDDLLDKLATAPEGERPTLLAEIDAELWADAYGMPLYQHPAVIAWGGRVEGVVASPWSPGPLDRLWRWQPTAGSESASPSR